MLELRDLAKGEAKTKLVFLKQNEFRYSAHLKEKNRVTDAKL